MRWHCLITERTLATETVPPAAIGIWPSLGHRMLCHFTARDRCSAASTASSTSSTTICKHVRRCCSLQSS